MSLPRQRLLANPSGCLKLIAFLLRPVRSRWLNLSFPSTLYLCPILDLLLQEVSSDLHCELRLGLQEALVNAAKHGNQLNPGKSVSVRYRRLTDRHEWIIIDQGLGFTPPSTCELFVSDSLLPTDLPMEQCECGRGLYILFQVFDRVDWNDSGTELHLEKLLLKSSP